VDRRQLLVEFKARESGGSLPGGFLDRAPDRDKGLDQLVIAGRLLLLGGHRLLDTRHRIEHHAGVGIAVALGILAQKPAAARGFHEGFTDRIVILLARQGRAGGNRREGEYFVGHGKLMRANQCALR